MIESAPSTPDEAFDDDEATVRDDKASDDADDDDADRAQEELLRNMIQPQPNTPRTPNCLATPAAQPRFQQALRTALDAIRSNGTPLVPLLKPTTAADNNNNNNSNTLPLHSLLTPDETLDAMLAKAVALNNRQPVPAGSLYACDVGAIVRRWLLWTTLLPRVVPHYAVKSNPCREVCATRHSQAFLSHSTTTTKHSCWWRCHRWACRSTAPAKQRSKRR
jgi:hypothetical protein